MYGLLHFLSVPNGCYEGGWAAVTAVHGNCMSAGAALAVRSWCLWTPGVGWLHGFGMRQMACFCKRCLCVGRLESMVSWGTDGSVRSARRHSALNEIGES